MPKKRTPRTEKQTNDKLATEAQRRMEGEAEDKALDAMVRQSIKLHGA